MSNLSSAANIINMSQSPDVAAGGYVLGKLSTASIRYWSASDMGGFTKGLLERLQKNGAEFDLVRAARYVTNHTAYLAEDEDS